MEDDDQWELCNDDGFVFKRKRRRIDAPPPSSDTDQHAALRRRKKQTLLKLKSKYQNEILQWESLSNTLRSIQPRATLQQPSLPSTFTFTSSSSSASPDTSLLHHLLFQVEAQEAIIRDVSNLCDIAEAVCVKREEHFKQTLLDLPIWASPLDLMHVLCSDDDD
ncbi:hypothetical protein VNO78_34132 [Psophocarpus tetragonolobus]|uniref:Uncharacterized protein n=1 Tax=Psophocarpus tetragonolobus TaxID=3891 RepID=A0AAN9RQ39_PSOTE